MENITKNVDQTVNKIKEYLSELTEDVYDYFVDVTPRTYTLDELVEIFLIELARVHLLATKENQTITIVIDSDVIKYGKSCEISYSVSIGPDEKIDFQKVVKVLLDIYEACKKEFDPELFRKVQEETEVKNEVLNLVKMAITWHLGYGFSIVDIMNACSKLKEKMADYSIKEINCYFPRVNFEECLDRNLEDGPDVNIRLTRDDLFNIAIVLDKIDDIYQNLR